MRAALESQRRAMWWTVRSACLILVNIRIVVWNASQHSLAGLICAIGLTIVVVWGLWTLYVCRKYLKMFVHGCWGYGRFKPNSWDGTLLECVGCGRLVTLQDAHEHREALEFHGYSRRGNV